MRVTKMCRAFGACLMVWVATRSVAAQTVLAVAARTNPSVSKDSAALRHASVIDTTAANDAPVERASLLGLKVSGYVESAFNLANHASGRVITGRLYERTSNQFSLNALTLSVDRAFDPTTMDAGFHADVIFGQNAPVLQSAGFNLGPNGDVYQLFGTINVPTSNGNGVQVRIGRMATLLGKELIETPLNPNVSIANQFIYVENFTQTGLSVEHRFNTHVDAQLRVFNGWDQVQDVNGRLSYMARIGLTPDANSSIAFSAFTGPEAANNNNAMRSGAEVLASRRIGRVTAFAQGDVGREQQNSTLPDPTRTATWWAAGTWVVISATPTIGVALRGDHLVDRASARTGSAFGIVGAPIHRLSSATATLNVKTVPNVLLRPELRFDRSNLPVFSSSSQQVTIGFSAAYLF